MPPAHLCVLLQLVGLDHDVHGVAKGAARGGGGGGGVGAPPFSDKGERGDVGRTAGAGAGGWFRTSSQPAGALC